MEHAPLRRFVWPGKSARLHDRPEPWSGALFARTQVLMPTAGPERSVPLAETDAIGTSSRTPLALRLNKVRAEVVQGPDKGASVEIGARRVVIGRAPDCDLVLSDTTVSSLHAELALEPNGVFVRNLGSRN